MCRERIWAVPVWRKDAAASRYDTVFLKKNTTTGREHGMHTLGIGRVRLFFTFCYLSVDYECALVDNYTLQGNGPDTDTGMWKVKRTIDSRSRSQISHVVALTEILRAAHLIPVFYGTPSIPHHITANTALDHYRNREFYVNKFVDYHAFETAF